MRIKTSFMALVISLIAFVGIPLWGQANRRSAPVKTRCEVPVEEAEVFVSYLKAETPSPGPTVLVTRTVPTEMDVDTFNLQLAAKVEFRRMSGQVLRRKISLAVGLCHSPA